jgi:hypothetical protein
MPRVLLLAFVVSTMSHAAAAEHAHSDGAAAQGVLSVDVYAAGDTIDVLTAERAGAIAPTLWYRRSTDGGKSWAEPVRVGEGMPVPHQPHRANDPQIASSGRQVVAVWASAGRGYRSSGPMVTALSSDGGRTWKRGPNPADDDRYDGHGFADVAARAGRFHLTWLDKRSGVQGVRYAYSNDAGSSWSRNMSVRSTSCECCWNTLLPARDRSVYLLFRGKAPRDMGIASSRDDGVSWKALGAVGAFNWQIEACPETGGALAATRQGASNRLHALVWTGQAGQRGVHFMSSLDGGADWSHGTRFGSEFAQRADLAARGEELVAVWDDIAGQNGAVFMSRSKNDGAEWSKPLKLSAERASAIYPRVVATNSSFLVLWTETSSNESQLRMLLLK